MVQSNMCPTSNGKRYCVCVSRHPTSLILCHLQYVNSNTPAEQNQRAKASQSSTSSSGTPVCVCVCVCVLGHYCILSPKSLRRPFNVVTRSFLNNRLCVCVQPQHWHIRKYYDQQHQIPHGGGGGLGPDDRRFCLTCIGSEERTTTFPASTKLERREGPILPSEALRNWTAPE